MSGSGNFFSRWSRRKHEAAEESDQTKTPAESEQAVENARAAEAAPSNGPAPPSDASESPAPIFDPASLPAIESITADTDIRAFLASGVPPELTRAALRRAWAADPKIRDFVGLADYDWDFNAPGSMAGFGPLEMTEELRQVVAQIIGPPPSDHAIGELDLAPTEVRSGQNSRETNAGEHPPVTEQNDQSAGIAQAAPKNTPDQSLGPDELPQRNKYIATQHQPERSETPPSIVRHTHGRALPK
jgi:hypothetical protein